MSNFYFAYGSNMNQNRMIERGLRFSSMIAATLPDAELLFNKKAADAPYRSYANVAYRQGSEVQGIAYELSGPDEIVKMDPFEGAPRLYSREIFILNTQQGPLAAWVYIANKAMIEDNLLPAQWYLDHLLAGKDYLSADYFEQLSKTKALDPDIDPGLHKLDNKP